MFNTRACVAQWIARLPPKEKVVGSNPTSGVHFAPAQALRGTDHGHYAVLTILPRSGHFAIIIL
jgi:hypothetical protein